MRTSAVIASFIALAASAPLDLPTLSKLPVDGVPAVPSGLPAPPEVGSLPFGLPKLPFKRDLGLPTLPNVGVPSLPEVNSPALPELGLPKLPVKRNLGLPAPTLANVGIPTGLPSLPEVGIPKFPEVGLPTLPEVGKLPVKRDGLGIFSNTPLLGCR